jgi:hypothetical protein
MGNPTTWHDCSLSPEALERTELMVGMAANRIRALPFQSLRSLITRRLSPSGRWGEMRPALSHFTPSHTINSVRSIAGDLKTSSRGVVGVQLENRL